MQNAILSIFFKQPLTKIQSNDGRTITFVYRSDGTIECVVGNNGSGMTGKVIWRYTFESPKAGTSLKYLKTAKKDRVGGKIDIWEFSRFDGVHSQTGNEYARRCNFVRGAWMKHSSRIEVRYTTEKIVNFEKEESPNGHIRTSQRAACLPPTDVYNNVGTYRNALKSASVTDGTSAYRFANNKERIENGSGEKPDNFFLRIR